MATEHYLTIQIAGEREEDFLREAYEECVEVEAQKQPVFPLPPEDVDLDYELLDDADFYDASIEAADDVVRSPKASPNPLEKRKPWTDRADAFREFRYRTKDRDTVGPDSIQPFIDLLPNLELGGDFRDVIEGLMERGKLNSLTDLSMLFRKKLDDAIRYNRFDAAILREADTFFSSDRRVLSHLGGHPETNLNKTNAYFLASAHPGIYKIFAGIFIADLNTRLQTRFIQAHATEDYAIAYSELSKMAYAAGAYAVEQGLADAAQLDAERTIERVVSAEFRRFSQLKAERVRRTKGLTDLADNQALLFGRRFRLRKGEGRSQRLERYKQEYPAWAKSRIAELEKQHLRPVLAAAYARKAGALSVAPEHFKAADELIKKARTVPGTFDRVSDLISLATGNDPEISKPLLQFFDKGRRRTELLSEIYLLGRTSSRVHDGRKVILSKDRKAGDQLAADAIIRSDLGVPSMASVQEALSSTGYSVTSLLNAVKRRGIPGVSRSTTRAIEKIEQRIESAAGTPAVLGSSGMSIDDFQAAKKHLKAILRSKIKPSAVRTATDGSADVIPKPEKPKKPKRKPKETKDDGKDFEK